MSYDQNANDGPLVIHFNPGELSDLAAVSVSAALMHDTIKQMRKAPNEDFDFYSVNLDGISLPPSIKLTIDDLVDDMVTARTQWWAYHLESVFSQNLAADTMIDWLDELVWLPGGTINYRQTAKKLLNGDKLTKMQKFQLACSYCFVEDVESLKSTLTKGEVSQFIDEFHTFGDAVSRYWCKKLKLGPLFYFYMNSRGVLFDSVISSLKHYDEWSTIEYFFNQLNDEVRLSKANTIIDLDKPKLTWHLLLTLTGSELDSVIRRRSRQIMMTLVKDCEFFENALSVWKRMVHLIDNNDLSDIILHVNDLDRKRSYVNSLLWEMWLSASERQKKFIIDERICDFIEKPNDLEYYFFYTPNFPLIIDILARSNPERRFEYLTAHWPYLVIGQLNQRNFIDRIMKLCIGNDQQIETFKNTVMINYDSISEYCEHLISYEHIDEVSNYLDFCTSDQQIIRDLKKMILTKMPERNLFNFLFHRSDVENMKIFNRYLDEIFTEHESKEFLNRIITRPDNLKEMRSTLTFWFRKVTEFVEKYVSSEKMLLKVKLNFFRNCRRDKSIPDAVLFDLATWCLNGDKVVTKKLKRLLSKGRKVSEEEVTSKPGSRNPVFDILMNSYQSCLEDE